MLVLRKGGHEARPPLQPPVHAGCDTVYYSLLLPEPPAHEHPPDQSERAEREPSQLGRAGPIGQLDGGRAGGRANLQVAVRTPARLEGSAKRGSAPERVVGEARRCPPLGRLVEPGAPAAGA